MADETKDKEAAAQPQAEKAPVQAAQGNKKINEMTTAELDAKLREVKEKMGNLHSSYAKQILRQKEILSKAKTG